MLIWKSPAKSILTEKEQTSQCGAHWHPSTWEVEAERGIGYSLSSRPA